MFAHPTFVLDLMKSGGNCMETRDISQILLEKNAEYRSLYEQHRSLEIRLVELSSRIYLSDSEKVEEVTLKKKKLALKDKMQALLNQHHG